jgi:hypothetical protein
MATTSTSAAAATTTTASTTAAAANAKVKPALPDKSKNIPLITTIGFEVSTAATSTNSSTSTTAASGATQSNAVNSEGGEQTAQEKAKTYITDYDIKETLGEGSFGAVSCSLSLSLSATVLIVFVCVRVVASHVSLFFGSIFFCSNSNIARRFVLSRASLRTSPTLCA